MCSAFIYITPLWKVFRCTKGFKALSLQDGGEEEEKENGRRSPIGGNGEVKEEEEEEEKDEDPSDTTDGEKNLLAGFLLFV